MFAAKLLASQEKSWWEVPSLKLAGKGKRCRFVVHSMIFCALDPAVLSSTKGVGSLLVHLITIV